MADGSTSKRSAGAKLRADWESLTSPVEAVALVPEAGGSSKPVDLGGTATVAETDNTIAVDASPPVPPARSGITGRGRRPRWPIVLVLVWAALAVTDIAVFHSSLGTNPARTSKTVAAGADAHRHAQATAPVPAPAKTRAPAPAVQVLAPVSASAYGPASSGSGDNPQNASMAIDESTATAWTTDWYRTAHFGGLQAGTGLLIDMGHPVTITSARIMLGNARGADLQVLTGRTPVLARMQRQASASDASGAVYLSLTRPGRARYMLIWFTRLPAASPGKFQASIYSVRLKGFSKEDLPGQTIRRSRLGSRRSGGL